MLAEYTAYLTRPARSRSRSAAAEKIMEDVFLSDVNFQDWFAARSWKPPTWEKVSVRVARGKVRACAGPAAAPATRRI